ncbi:hypothetical protein SAMN04487891_1184 [Flagellimonas taeanensis]|uniref:Uncharacterized protein n=1 Tax=Flagellimonas taeanensis TaxID=1005926 RepID=A0A1M7CV11_9FLAO|nr:tail fiber protein [Allomuricauda taeanensis]SFC65893.1 hypothetical protein SAMN04487891_1184 [Allomuricauda taeanensis]SHL71054.1 hypothetical protein SAMN05216293_4126 [Allomuricauda taeanensis]
MKRLSGLLAIIFTVTLHGQVYESSNGNVGIGTTLPNAKLHVAGNGAVIKLQNTEYENTENSFYGWIGGYDKSGQEVWWLGEGSANNKQLGFFVNSAYDLKIYNNNQGIKINQNGRLNQEGNIPNDNSAVFVNNSVNGYGIYSKGGNGSRYAFHFENQSGQSIIYGQGNGRIGIGTTYPDAKLAVKGNIHAEEVKVDLSVPGPDYVFKEGYDLKSLEEVQNYINEHGHLPNIPSAKEMEEEGIQLGEMNMKLLEKIEELTLYVIKQQGEIDYLKSIIK